MFYTLDTNDFKMLQALLKKSFILTAFSLKDLHSYSFLSRSMLFLPLSHLSKLHLIYIYTLQDGHSISLPAASHPPPRQTPVTRTLHSRRENNSLRRRNHLKQEKNFISRAEIYISAAEMYISNREIYISAREMNFMT